MKTTTNAAMKVTLEIGPLHLYIQKEAALSCLRLRLLKIRANVFSQMAISDRMAKTNFLIHALCDSVPKIALINNKYTITVLEK